MLPKAGKAVKDSMITLARQKVHRIKEEYNKGEEERRLQRKRTREAEEEKGKRKKQKLEERDERLAQSRDTRAA